MLHPIGFIFKLYSVHCSVALFIGRAMWRLGSITGQSVAPGVVSLQLSHFPTSPSFHHRSILIHSPITNTLYLINRQTDSAVKRRIQNILLLFLLFWTIYKTACLCFSKKLFQQC
jgi:hypothetical protein